MSQSKKLRKRQSISNIQYQQSDFDETYSTLEATCIKFSLLHKPTDDSLTINRAISQINQLKEKLSNIENQIVALQTIKGEVKALNEIVTSKLTNLTEKEYFDLADLLISNIQVHNDYILLSYFFNDFFEKELNEKMSPINEKLLKDAIGIARRSDIKSFILLHGGIVKKVLPTY